MTEVKKDHKCPFCESLITKEQYDKVIEENELLKKKAKELEEIIKKLELEKAKLQEKIKDAVDKEKVRAQKKSKEFEKVIKKLQSEKIQLQGKIKEAIDKEKIKAQKLQEDIKKLKEEKARFKDEIKDVRIKERQRFAEKLEKDTRIIEKLKEENELLKKGMTAQEMGFDFENKMHDWLERKFDQDKVEKTGKKGDSLLRIMSKDKEVGIILIECKRKDKHTSADVEEVKRHKINAKANIGVLITNGYFGKRKMDGFCNIDGILVIRPHSALEFIDLLREHIIEVENYKLTEEEKNKELTRLWKFIHSPEFESQMNAILRDVNKLKELDTKERDILEKRGEIEEDILKAHKLIIEGITKTRKKELEI